VIHCGYCHYCYTVQLRTDMLYFESKYRWTRWIGMVVGYEGYFLVCYNYYTCFMVFFSFPLVVRPQWHAIWIASGLLFSFSWLLPTDYKLSLVWIILIGSPLHFKSIESNTINLYCKTNQSSKNTIIFLIHFYYNRINFMRLRKQAIKTEFN